MIRDFRAGTSTQSMGPQVQKYDNLNGFWLLKDRRFGDLVVDPPRPKTRNTLQGFQVLVESSFKKSLGLIYGVPRNLLETHLLEFVKRGG